MTPLLLLQQLFREAKIGPVTLQLATNGGLVLSRDGRHVLTVDAETVWALRRRGPVTDARSYSGHEAPILSAADLQQETLNAVGVGG